MATLTIRNLPEDLIERLKKTAQRQGRSMEEEVRELLKRRYSTKQEVIERIRQRWDAQTTPSAQEVDHWITATRNRSDHGL